jgi:hypothetical protein
MAADKSRFMMNLRRAGRMQFQPSADGNRRKSRFSLAHETLRAGELSNGFNLS